MPQLLAPQMRFAAGAPDRLVMLADVSREESYYLATEAVYIARQTMPRVTGVTASRLATIVAEGYFGIYFPDATTWFLEAGTRAFTMRSLAGKTIPMWVSDTDGQLRRDNPKIRIHTTEDGRLQVLIFRRAARLGQRKVVRRKDPVTGQLTLRTTVASYPGAPGRINRRQPAAPWNASGTQGGQIAGGNVGVRWRHPGIQAMQFLNGALARTAFEAGLPITTVYAVDGASWQSFLSFRLRGVQ
jgi:hypothetical protein